MWYNEQTFTVYNVDLTFSKDTRKLGKTLEMQHSGTNNLGNLFENRHYFAISFGDARGSEMAHFTFKSNKETT